jgi:hypothetical protein
VPPDHLVRQIDAVLDLGWVHKELAPYYSHTGRPSIDPALMNRLLIIGYVFAIRSFELVDFYSCGISQSGLRGIGGCRTDLEALAAQLRASYDISQRAGKRETKLKGSCPNRLRSSSSSQP